MPTPTRRRQARRPRRTLHLFWPGPVPGECELCGRDLEEHPWRRPPAGPTVERMAS